MYEYSGKVLKVIDGDTIEAQIDLGFDIFTVKRVRLANIDAPEVRTKNKEEKLAGKKAKNRLIEIFQQNNDRFVLKSLGIGKFGRCLGEVIVNNQSVSKLLLEENLATE